MKSAADPEERKSPALVRGQDVPVYTTIASDEHALPHVRAGVYESVRAYLQQKLVLGGISVQVLSQQFPGVPTAFVLESLEQLAAEGVIRIAGDACGVYVTAAQGEDGAR